MENELPKPKYNIGDKVWRVINNSCVEETITGIQLSVNFYFGDDSYTYSISHPHERPAIPVSTREIKHLYLIEDDLFPSKEALINHLSAN